MKFTSVQQIDGFLDTLRKCDGDVWLESKDGDKINLKSRLSRYVAISDLLSDEGNNLELYCAKGADEALFLAYFDRFPETV